MIARNTVVLVSCAFLGVCSGSDAGAVHTDSLALRRAPIPLDSSFTLARAAAKIRTVYPSAIPVLPQRPPGILHVSEVVYATRDGRALHLDVFRPEDTRAQRVPVVLVFHGGGWRSGERSMEVPMAERLALAGYVAATIEYRLSPEARYPAALSDGLEAIRWMRANAERFGADPNAIALCGCSSGGHLVSLLGVTASGPPGKDQRVQAIINIDGPVDLTDSSESGKDVDPAKPSSAALWLGATYAERPDLWREASPAFHVDPRTPPMIFINSGELRYRAGRDRMVAAMESVGIPCSVRVVADAPHTFWLFHPWHDQVAAYAVEFLERVLRNR